jgi:hypothetical protein
MARTDRLRMAAASLLVLATIVLVIGITAERSVAGEPSPAGSTETGGVTGSEPSEDASEEGVAGHDEGEAVEGGDEAGSGEVIGEPESEGEEAHADEATELHNEGNETMFGIDPESTGAIAAAVIISLLLAAALWFWRTPTALIVAVVFALLFAVLDLREVMHQLSEARGGLAAIAVVAAVLHIGVALIAGLGLTRGDSIGTAT